MIPPSNPESAAATMECGCIVRGESITPCSRHLQWWQKVLSQPPSEYGMQMQSVLGSATQPLRELISRWRRLANRLHGTSLDDCSVGIDECREELESILPAIDAAADSRSETAIEAGIDYEKARVDFLGEATSYEPPRPTPYSIREQAQRKGGSDAG